MLWCFESVSIRKVVTENKFNEKKIMDQSNWKEVNFKKNTLL